MNSIIKISDNAASRIKEIISGSQKATFSTPIETEV